MTAESGPVDPASPGAGPPPSLGAAVSTGVRWGLTEQLGQQLVRFGVMVVLTRAVSPADFGLIGMAFVFTQLAALLSDLGLAPALVQRRTLSDAHVSTAFTASVLFGAAMTVSLLAAARPIAGFFDEPRLAGVVAALSVTFILNGARETPRYLFRRGLDFAPVAVTAMVGTVAGGAVGVALALAGAGVWALVALTLVEVLVGTLLINVLAVQRRIWRPAIGMSRAALGDLLGFAAILSVVRFLYYGQNNLDNLLVGRFLGATSLGLYGLAYRVMLFPLQRIADVLTGVAFPAFAAIQDDRERLRAGFTRAVEAICLVCIPISIGTAVAAPVLVPLVFGERWEPAVATLQILALNGPRLAVNRVNGALYQATGRPAWELAISSLSFALYLVGFTAGLPFGIAGVAIGFTIAGHVVLPVSQALVSRALRSSPAVLLSGILPIGVAAALMALAAELTRRLLGEAPHVIAAVGVVGVGAIVYGLAVFLFARPTLTHVRADLLRRGVSR